MFNGYRQEHIEKFPKLITVQIYSNLSKMKSTMYKSLNSLIIIINVFYSKYVSYFINLFGGSEDSTQVLLSPWQVSPTDVYPSFCFLLITLMDGLRRGYLQLI